MFAGRQIHPFFSSRKVGKKFQEPAESELSLCAAKRKDEEVITYAPIHVFENIPVRDLSYALLICYWYSIMTKGG